MDPAERETVMKLQTASWFTLVARCARRTSRAGIERDVPFAIDVSISPDSGCFWQGNTAGHLQSTMQIQFVDSGDGTYSLNTGTSEPSCDSGTMYVIG